MIDDPLSRSAICYENELNPAQLEAVRFMNGPLLVIAGAGSGKTRTLIYRVARLVENGVRPDAILLLTFTKKSASHMLERSALLLDDRCARVSGGTFHSFANAMLRRYAPGIGLPHDFTIIDRSDSESIMGLIKKEMNVPSDRHHRFPGNRTLINLFNRAVNKGISIEETVANAYPHLSKFMDAIILAGQNYDAHKAKHFFLDYDDLLIYFRNLLRDNAEISERIQSRYSHIMVDEYQDTNQIQAEIIFLLAGDKKNIMVVGDDSQSIYGFRGAKIKNMLEFPDTFPGTQIIRLEENYRSNQPILDLTNTVIDQVSEKFSKTLFTRKKGGLKPVLAAMENESAQSHYVVEKIKDLLANGSSPDSICVLFRAGFHSYDLEMELNKNRCPFVKAGGFKFVETAHIKDFMAYLRVMANPLDRISWHRILLLLDKIGPKTAQKIYESVEHANDGLWGVKTVTLKSSAAPGFEELKELLLAAAETETLYIQQIGERILNYYVGILKKKYDDHPKRTKDLEQLLTIMDRYDDVKQFLSDMALEPPNSSGSNGKLTAEGSADRLSLSTIHSAKGLEWRHVFIIWALDGRFPTLRSMDDENELEEELRLMYVAATRAKENLFITYPMRAYDRASGLVLDRPSRFLDAVPDYILEREFPTGIGAIYWD